MGAMGTEGVQIQLAWMQCMQEWWESLDVANVLTGTSLGCAYMGILVSCVHRKVVQDVTMMVGMNDGDGSLLKF
jgi:hypothetical protein